ncbi:carboxymuconolactone decarboxylase family protein [Methanoplanus sp. FWC-SCC4]|uniref:Carboxymuconolactone decarboxylase family protein n=1 Tax=Methanochimaera problematica TaxID=2609417 RepID=A0AA97FAZ5_9EURY|nr:carboxymuconolactone decarboxylase family protein [Methanoplanus sp. FWC-SCC4]WOF16075.1 carboxymuconolactone decarboxylase family protein [Methanoplanus sp. FWC-SCC4]
MKENSQKAVDEFFSHADEIGDDLLEDFKEIMGQVPFIFKVLRQRPESFAPTALAEYMTLRPENLDPKTAELITISAAVAADADNCLNVHIKAAMENGATKEEILDTILIAAMIGKTKLLASSLRVFKTHFPDEDIPK